MDRFRLGIAKVVGLIVVLVLIVSNVAWFVAYHAQAGELDRANAQVAALGKTPTATPGASTPAPAAKGTISGSVGFPAGTAPAQSVCAVSTIDAAAKFCVDHAAGNALGYQLAVPAGSYTVYASLKAPQGDYKTSYKAYYDKYVTCGAKSDCAMGLHGQNEVVTVAVGGTVTGVDPTDWYALGITQ